MVRVYLAQVTGWMVLRYPWGGALANVFCIFCRVDEKKGIYRGWGLQLRLGS